MQEIRKDKVGVRASIYHHTNPLNKWETGASCNTTVIIAITAHLNKTLNSQSVPHEFLTNQ